MLSGQDCLSFDFDIWALFFLSTIAFPYLLCIITKYLDRSIKIDLNVQYLLSVDIGLASLVILICVVFTCEDYRSFEDYYSKFKYWGRFSFVLIELVAFGILLEENRVYCALSLIWAKTEKATHVITLYSLLSFTQYYFFLIVFMFVVVKTYHVYMTP